MDRLPIFLGMGLHLLACGALLNIVFGQEAVWLAVKVLELESGGPELSSHPNR